jgi:enterochelin esterase family protein
MSTQQFPIVGAALAAFALIVAPVTVAPAQFGGPKGPIIASPEVKADRNVAFRLHAPKAATVAMFTSDLPGDPRPRTMKKDDRGVWELSVGPVDPGTYRYLFQVDGVLTADPRNQAVSESNGNVWSLVHVPGSSFMDATNVPHGAVARIHYRSTALGKDRRMHVYTPPGYHAGSDKHPVLYLLHGAGDSDDSWTSVGRANFILDNLIAAKKAKPMLVVMPNGHTGAFSWIMPTERPKDAGPVGNTKFEDDFLSDIIPPVENNYRVLTSPANRAIAGLSMGGNQTINIVFARPKDFGYAGVFSSGLIFEKTSDWEKSRKAALAEAKENLKLLWFATGSEDFLIGRTKETAAMLEKNGLQPVVNTTSGGHTWINWQRYLHEFAPKVFQ